MGLVAILHGVSFIVNLLCGMQDSSFIQTQTNPICQQEEGNRLGFGKVVKKKGGELTALGKLVSSIYHNYDKVNHTTNHITKIMLIIDCLILLTMAIKVYVIC